MTFPVDILSHIRHEYNDLDSAHRTPLFCPPSCFFEFRVSGL